MIVSVNIYAQKMDSLIVYKTGFCLNYFNVDEFLKIFESRNYTKEQIMTFASNMSWHGNDKYGNELAKKCIAKNDSITAGNWHAYSVQNTKNGNYAEAIYGLENSLAIAPQEMEGYYGWVLLYYYRDYQRALLHLNHYDSLTPNAVDAPVGENIHFLKGLCYYQLNQYEKSIEEFNINAAFELKSFGKKNVNAYIYFYIARNYEKLNNLKLAETYYKKAIKTAQFPVEANYYLGMMYKYKKDNRTKAMTHFLNAYHFLQDGYKQQDIYVELFDEVYLSQIDEEFEY